MKPTDRGRDHYERLDDKEDKRGEGSENSPSWKVLFNFTTKAHSFLLVPALLCSCLSGAINPAMAIFLGRFFNSLSEYGGGEIGGDSMILNSLTSIYGLIVLGGITWMLKGGFFCLWVSYGELQAKVVRDLLFESLLQKDVEWYEAHSNGMNSLLLRLQTQIRELQIGVSQPFGFVCMCVAQGLASTGVALYYNWKLTLVILSTTPMMALIMSFIRRGLPIAREAEETALSAATGIASNALMSIVTVKCFNTESLENGRYQQSLLTVAKHYRKQVCINAFEIGFSRFGSAAVVVAGVVYGIELIHQDKSTTAKVLTAFWSCISAANAFEDILPHLLLLRKGCSAAIVLRSICDHVTQRSGTIKSLGGLCPGELHGYIEFRNVSFAYPSYPNRVILRNITFSLPAGRTTLFIGQSGSGKSTIGNLLLKFYAVQKGSISIDGRDIEELNTTWLRNNITLVQQHSHLFEGTIYHNIVLGRPGRSHIMQDQVEQSLEFATFSTSMEGLADGINTRVELGGSDISVGQRQRVALARARLRDAPIVILDESTSALDFSSRNTVMQNIRAWRKDRTTIIITHDLSQAIPSDFLYILNEEGVIAKGRYDALLGTLGAEGLFKRDIQTDGTHWREPYGEYTKDRAKHSQAYSPCRSSDESHHRQNSEDSLDRILSLYQKVRTSSTTFGNTKLRSSNVQMSSSLDQPAPATPRTFLHNMSKRAAPLVSSVLPLREDDRSSRSSQLKPRTIRPMSMHHAITMRSLYEELDRNETTQSNSKHSKPFTASSLPPTRTHESPGTDVWAERKSSRSWTLAKIFTTIWPTLSVSEKFHLLAGILATTIHATCPPVFSYLLAKLLTTLYLQEGWQSSARTYSLCLAGVAIIDGLTSFVLHYVMEVIGQTWVNALRVRALQRVTNLPKAWFDMSYNTPSRICSILDHNANEMRNLLGRFAAPLYVVVIVIGATLVWAFTQCWKLTVIGLGSVPLMYATTRLFSCVSSHWESLTNSKTTAVTKVFTEAFSDIRTVRALTLESHFHQKYTKATSQAFAVGMRRAVYSGILFGLSDAMLLFVTAALFGYGAVLARSGSYSVESILTVFTLLLFSMTTVTSIITYIPQISSSVNSASHLLDLSTLSIVSHETQNTTPLDKTYPITTTGSIQFINQTFYYPSRPDTIVLNNVSFTIPCNSYTAIVGTSGSGKSTIASLLLGLYPPQTPIPSTNTNPDTTIPKILISGRDIRTLSTTQLRATIGYVAQTPMLFPGTIRENILYGLPHTTTTTTDNTAQLYAAARSASIHDFIQTLPEGYDTIVGAGGQTLSGGQVQRIAVARALARNPKILILDEPTSALDWGNRDAIRRNLMRLVRRDQMCTVIVITHAREMVDGADHVVVLEKGRVVEEGGVDELLRRKGWLCGMMKSGRGARGDSSDYDDDDDPGEGPSGLER